MNKKEEFKLIKICEGIGKNKSITLDIKPYGFGSSRSSDKKIAEKNLKKQCENVYLISYVHNSNESYKNYRQSERICSIKYPEPEFEKSDDREHEMNIIETIKKIKNTYLNLCYSKCLEKFIETRGYHV